MNFSRPAAPRAAAGRGPSRSQRSRISGSRAGRLARIGNGGLGQEHGRAIVGGHGRLRRSAGRGDSAGTAPAARACRVSARAAAARRGSEDGSAETVTGRLPEVEATTNVVPALEQGRAGNSPQSGAAGSWPEELGIGQVRCQETPRVPPLPGAPRVGRAPRPAPRGAAAQSRSICALRSSIVAKAASARRRSMNAQHRRRP